MLEEKRFKGHFPDLIPAAGEELRFHGLTLSAAAFVLAEILRVRPQTVLMVLPTPMEAEDFVRNLEFFWPEGTGAGRIMLLPGVETRPFSGESPSADLMFARLWALYSLLTEVRPLVVVASAAGMMQRCLPRKALADSVELLAAGDEVDRDGLVEVLSRRGYVRTQMVTAQSDFAVRGGILDVYPPGARRPVRAEFFGDVVDSLRSFRTLDQRSVETLQEQVLITASEVIYGPGIGDRAGRRLARLAGEAKWLDLLWVPLAEQISLGQYFPGVESFWPLFHDETSVVEDFAGRDALWVLFEPDRVVEAAREHEARLVRHMDRILEEERPHLPLADLYRSPEAVLAGARDRAILISDLPFADASGGGATVRFQVEANTDLAALTTETRGAGLLGPLAARIKSWRVRELDVALACHTREQGKRMAELLAEYDLIADRERQAPGVGSLDTAAFRVVTGFLTAGFCMEAAGRAFVTEDELFGPKRKLVRRAAEEVKGLHLSSFQDLTVGDFVVHNDHGIGQYMGLVKLEVEGRTNDYLFLAYKGGDKLYVPVDRFNAVGKYVGSEDRPPALDKLGGTSWEKVKAKVKASIQEMAEELLELYASRQLSEGHAYSSRDTFFKEFEASFPYEETPDQMAAIDDVLRDMASKRPMDRLVCGDVGYGKTEVALRAAFKSVQDGKQAVVLVPTTVLAEQHFQTFKQRLENYPITVEVISRFRKAAEQKEILAQLAEGRIDIIVGTHRLLSKDVIFKDLGLLIIDEEHRFGVTAKERLKRLKAQVDVLTLSATPIPRTLSMSLSGIRDLSIIETAPQHRLSIKTFLLKYDEPTIVEAVTAELERGGQVFFVHNRVKDIEQVAGRLRALMPLVRVEVAHGQQSERELEGVMLKFLKREIDVLVTTTIIESGLDFPTANTIIINNADRFGLSQIYQIRGRVGRSTSQAYSYLLVAQPETLTRDARKRLRALMDFSDLGAGFKIALHDLQIRGAGNLLGAAQSGQIAAVGYDMYVQLMEKAIKDMKGESVAEEDPEMTLGVAAYIPESYVADTEERLVHYRRLSSITHPDDLEDIAKEFKDRYGDLPQETQNLIQAMELKHWLRRIRANRLEVGKSGLTLSFGATGPAKPDRILDLIQRSPKKARLSPEGRLFLSMEGLVGTGGLAHIKKLLHGLAQDR